MKTTMLIQDQKLPAYPVGLTRIFKQRGHRPEPIGAAAGRGQRNAPAAARGC